MLDMATPSTFMFIFLLIYLHNANTAQRVSLSLYYAFCPDIGVLIGQSLTDRPDNVRARDL